MKLITRSEISQLIGINKEKLVGICNIPGLNFPRPVSRKINTLFYDQDEVLAWSTLNPHKNIIWQNNRNPDKKPVVTDDYLLRFLTGKFDPPVKRARYDYRRVIAKHTKPKTICIRTVGDW